MSKDNHLAAFIDFEGMMSGDPLLGIGYILSHSSPTHPFTRLILEQYNIDRDVEVKKHLTFMLCLDILDYPLIQILILLIILLESHLMFFFRM
ncbi:hypothetical protein [Paraprevotella clara]|nr:hypothetical protein [Paraprevotella clara]